MAGWAKTSANPRSMGPQTAKDAASTAEWLQQKVRHELVMLPYYSVFDHITYKVEGDRVELAGQVHRPTLRSGAARVVQQIEGVSSVTNNIEVLPLSPNDDRSASASIVRSTVPVRCLVTRSSPCLQSHHREEWAGDLGRRCGQRDG
jgi:hypothetical protein